MIENIILVAVILHVQKTGATWRDGSFGILFKNYAPARWLYITYVQRFRSLILYFVDNAQLLSLTYGIVVSD